jgi:hypothetical protein
MAEGLEGLGGSAPTAESILGLFEQAGDFGDDLEQPEVSREDAEADLRGEDKPAVKANDDSEDDAKEAKAKESDEDKADSDDDAIEMLEFETDDGQTEQVPVSELLDLHKRKSELQTNIEQVRADVAQQTTQQFQEHFAALENQAQVLGELQAQYNEFLSFAQEPDIRVLNQDPELYRQQMLAYQQVKGFQQEVDQKVANLKEEYTKTQEAARQASAERDWAALVAADPTWKKGDAAKRLTDLRQGVSSAFGIEPDVVATITHPGFIRMAEAALKAANAKRIEPKAKESPKVTKGKTGSADGAERTVKARRVKAARQQLQKTGRVTDLEGVWGQFVD